MNEKNSVILKSLIKAFENNSFEIEVKKLIEEEKIERKTLGKLCGINIDGEDNFIEKLKAAIQDYKSDRKIVTKVKNCTMDCGNEEGETKCEKSCPFNAIIKSKTTNSLYIDDEKCTDCGFCVEFCNEGCFQDRVEFIPLFNLIKSGAPVIAAVAPAIVGQFGSYVSMDQLRAAFKKIGFLDMVEVAFFADMLTLKEAVEFNHLVKKEEDLMITSCCCPMWVGMLKKVYEDLVKHVSPSVSPMIAAGKVLKELNSQCKVVFIGPCIAKKAEAKEKDLVGIIDFVLTFVELKEIFDSLNIDPAKLEGVPSTEYASKGGRIYGRTGGVSIAVSDAVKRMFPEKHKFFKPIQAHGVKDCKELLAKAQAGNINANFIEGMGCIGGCVGGPKALISKEEGTDKINNFAENSEVQVAVDSYCMIDILKKLNITSAEDFKNEEKTKIFKREF